MNKEQKISLDLRDHDEETQAVYSIRNQFINDEVKYTLIRTMTALCPKLILAGSVSLHVLGVNTIDFKVRNPDLDFGLTEPITEEELDGLIGFLNLKLTSAGDIYDLYSDEVPTSKQAVQQDLIRLFDEKNNIFIDIFNSNFDNDFRSKHNNLYPINFGHFDQSQIIYVQSPAVTISHKVKYSFYPKYHKRKKHKDDCVDFLCKNYVNILQKIDGYNDLKRTFEKALQMKFKDNLSDLRYKLESNSLNNYDLYN